MTATRLLVAVSTPSPLYPAEAGASSPVPLWLGVVLVALVVFSSVVVLLPPVRHALDRVSSRRPRRFRD
ncbi:hypothetical protein EDF38_1193 [Frigoribacterium sp. PhB160]|uniref:hypothetical protein n=1 Tax=Frigoribacterium sp. PhB160 TaxID=2485192 RepID=UPI000F473C18|nr:hypothetical protein [Frigoribacterium sp. PhB160]ROS62091.1 hypothetical protein EDF38_1193 [Frigoribacterium sp. PhB160]